MWSSRRAEKKTDAVSLSSTLGDPTTMLVVKYFNNVMHHYKEGNLRYPTIAYISLVHIAAGVGLFKLLDCSTETLLWALLWISSVFGITVGAHRLWSHRSFEASFTVRLLLVLCNSIANHRLHHKYRGTDADPHNISWGSFFAHMGWFLVEKHPCTARVDVSDLEEDSLVAAQHKLFNPSSLYMCFIMPAQVASRCWDEDFGTALLVCGVLRYVMVLHCSCWINSRGSAPRREKSRYYLFDYAASEFGIKYDPSTMLFDLLALTGLVWGRRRVSERRRRRRDVIVVKGIPPPREIAFKKLETSNEFDLWTFEGTSD